MPKNRDLDAGLPLPANQWDALNEFIGTQASPNFTYRIRAADPTILEVPAGAGDDQVAIAIDGRWRFNTAVVGLGGIIGAARSLDVHVTASDNVFRAPVGGEVGEQDSTIYTFGLAITETGVAPGGVALSRKVGTAAWDGAKFTATTPAWGIGLQLELTTVGRVSFGDTNLYRAAADALGSDDDLILRAAQPERLYLGAIAAGVAGMRFGSAADANLYRAAAAHLKTDGRLEAGAGADVSGSTATLNTGGAGIGDKILLFGGAAGSSYGFGIQNSRLVAYMPAAGGLAVRASATTGHGSSGADAITLLANGQLTFGVAGDTNLYRSAASSLKTDDNFFAALALIANASGANQIGIGTLANGAPGINFGSAEDTNLYRKAANTLKTDDALVAASYVSANDGLASEVVLGYSNIVGGLAPAIRFANDTHLAREAAGVLGGVSDLRATRYVRSNSGGANSVILGYNSAVDAPAIAFGAALDTYVQREAATLLNIQSLRISGNIGFYGANPIAKQNIVGARSEPAWGPQGDGSTVSVANDDVLAQVLTALANVGLITNSTTA